MDLLVLSGGGPSGDKTAGARLLVADPERSVGDCPDEVLTGLEEAPEAAAAAADLDKRFGGVLLLPGGSLGPSGGGVLLELGFAASPKISLRPECWEAGLDMEMEMGCIYDKCTCFREHARARQKKRGISEGGCSRRHERAAPRQHTHMRQLLRNTRKGGAERSRKCFWAPQD